MANPQEDVGKLRGELISSMRALVDQFENAKEALGRTAGSLTHVSQNLAGTVTNIVSFNAGLTKVIGPANTAIDSMAKAIRSATESIEGSIVGNTGAGGGGGGGGGGRGGRDEDSADEFYFKLSNIRTVADALTGSMDFASQAVVTFTSYLGPLVDVFQIHQTLMNKLNASVTDIPQQFESLQQQLLGLGTSIPNFESTFASELDGLIGDDLQNISNAANLMSQGLRGNFKGLLQVAAKMDLTGQKSGLLTNEFIRFSIAMQSNGAQMNNMALALQRNAETYNVKTEDLIKVIGSIKNMDVMGALGFGPQFTSNLTSLAAEFKIGQDQITGLINSLTTPETFAKIAAVDPTLAGLVSQLEQATGPEQFKSAFKEIVMKLGSFAQSLGAQAGGAGLPSTIVGSQLFAMFGPALLQASQMLQILTGDLTEQQKAVQRELDITNSFNAVVLELKNQFTPLLQNLLSLSKTIMEGKGAYFLLGGIVLKLTTNIISAALTTYQFYKSLDRAATVVRNFAIQKERERLANADPMLGAKGTGPYGKLASMLGGPLGKIGLLLGPIGIGVSIFSALLPLFSKTKDSTDNQTQAVQAQTQATQQLVTAQTAQNQSLHKDLSARDSIYAGMSRALQSSITGDRIFIEMLGELKTTNRITEEKMNTLIKTQVDSIIRSSGSTPAKRP